MAMYPKGKMVQLSGKSGKVEAQLNGAERIYSRVDTEKIIKLAKSAKSRTDLIELGRVMMNATKTQDSKDPQFTGE